MLVSSQAEGHERRLEVRSAAGDYPAYVGQGLLARCGGFARAILLLKARRACAVVTDATVGTLHAEPVLASLRAEGYAPFLVVVPPGERSKSLAEAGRVADIFTAHGLDRHGFVVALGGGVVGDLAGFAASIYYRGLPVVGLPTTVISQADSAVGGKTGVNTAAGKNLLGTFHPPCLVLADVDTLATLPEREYNEGFAEVIKHGAIRDRRLLDGLADLKRGDPAALAVAMHRNLEIKAAIVAADEFETRGLRALLNFGHTVGHAVEQAAGYGRFLHGEAIALGLVAAGRLSMDKAGLPAADFAVLLGCLRHFELPMTLPDDVTDDAILASLARDKKFEAGRVRFVLVPRLGEAVLSTPGEVTLDDVRREVSRLRLPA